MTTRSSVSARLVDIGLLGILAGLAAILTAAMVLQYAGGEIPCPLCLLQRVAMFGICFGVIRHTRDGFDGRNIGISLVWALFLLLVSVRQVLLNIVKRPGHAYPGSAVFGLHMPVWSVVIAFAVLLAFAGVLALFGDERPRAGPRSPLSRRVADLAGLYVMALCLINLVSAVVQCGFAACHTTGYRML